MFKRLFSLRAPILEDLQGNMLIEAAIFFPFLVIVFFGVVEITQYIDVRERVDRLANQMVDYYGGLTANTTNIVGSLNTSFSDVKNIMTDIAAPHSISIDVTFCSPNAIFSNGLGYVNSFRLDFAGAGATPGVCGFGDPVPGYTAPVFACPTGAAPLKCSSPDPINGYCPGLQDLVIVTAGCNYSPMFNFLNLFSAGITVSSGPLVVPLRANSNP